MFERVLKANRKEADWEAMTINYDNETRILIMCAHNENLVTPEDNQKRNSWARTVDRVMWWTLMFSHSYSGFSQHNQTTCVLPCLIWLDSEQHVCNLLLVNYEGNNNHYQARRINILSSVNRSHRRWVSRQTIILLRLTNDTWKRKYVLEPLSISICVAT